MSVSFVLGVPDPSASQIKEHAAMMQQTCPVGAAQIYTYAMKIDASNFVIQGCCSSTQYNICTEKLDIEGEDQKLLQQDQSLKQAVQERIGIAKKFTTLGEMIQEIMSRIEQLLQKKNDLETTLKRREHGLQLLNQQSATQEMEQQEQFVLLQKKEISDLKEELVSVRDELEGKNAQLSAMEKELQKVTVELAEKSAEVRTLRETKEEMKSLLKGYIRRTDDCLMQKAATHYGREVKVSTIVIIWK